MTFEQQVREYQLTKASCDCENIAGRLMYYGASFMTGDILGLWADREDCCLELPYGIYQGKDSIRRYYCEALGDREDASSAQKLLGAMCQATLDTPVIEVAEDLRTARGLWFSPGIETYGQAAVREEFRCRGFWMWAKLAADFIFEDGQWKLWHVWLHQVFRTDYHETWAPGGPYLGFAFGDAMADRPPRAGFRPYRSDERQDPGPSAPQPYRTFSEVYPGYAPPQEERP